MTETADDLEQQLERIPRFHNRGGRLKLLRFLAQDRSHSLYNNLLIQIQHPGAKAVATAADWKSANLTIKANAKPILILQPGVPVRFEFDLSDTDGEMITALPPPVTLPPERLHAHLLLLKNNLWRDGIKLDFQLTDHPCFGTITPAQKDDQPSLLKPPKASKRLKPTEQQYALALGLQSEQESFIAIVRELGHLYCGHLGSAPKSAWPDRSTLSPEAKLYEADAVAYLVGERLGLATALDKTLTGDAETAVPSMSIKLVLQSAMQILEMAGRVLGNRKLRATPAQPELPW